MVSCLMPPVCNRTCIVVIGVASSKWLHPLQEGNCRNSTHLLAVVAVLGAKESEVGRQRKTTCHSVQFCSQHPVGVKLGTVEGHGQNKALKRDNLLC